MYKILEIAANQAYETTHYNMTGLSPNPVIKFTNQLAQASKVREFFVKDPVFRTFLSGIERKDERVIMQMTKAHMFSAGDRIIRNKCRDRCLLFVIKGSLFGLDDTFPVTRNLFKQGSVIGID